VGRPLWRVVGSVSCQSLSAVIVHKFFLYFFPLFNVTRFIVKQPSLFSFVTDSTEDNACSSSSVMCLPLRRPMSNYLATVVLTKLLPSSRCLSWLHSSYFEESCHSTEQCKEFLKCLHIEFLKCLMRCVGVQKAWNKRKVRTEFGCKSWKENTISDLGLNGVLKLEEVQNARCGLVWIIVHATDSREQDIEPSVSQRSNGTSWIKDWLLYSQEAPCCMRLFFS
jgi:hypothetical protein